MLPAICWKVLNASLGLAFLVLVGASTADR